MKYFAIVLLVLSSACASSIRLPGTVDPVTEQIRLLTHAIEKQSEAIVAISGKATPTPTPTPTPEVKPSHFGEEPTFLIADKGSKQ